MLKQESVTDSPQHLSPRRRVQYFDFALLAILLLAVYFRAQYLDLPMAEAHRWREVTNSDIARQFYERSMNIIFPQVNWGGDANPYVGMEFPLMHWIVAAIYHVTGEQAIVGRLLSMTFSVGSVWAVYMLGTFLFGAPAGRGAAFFMAISPSSIFFGRFFISDTPMVFFSVVGLLGWVVYLETRSTAACLVGTVGTALAFLVKIPAVMLMAPIAWAAWERDRWKALTDKRLMGGCVAAFLAMVLWYWWADYIYHWTGLSEAIWHPSGTYPPPISLATGRFSTISHWATRADLTDPSFYTDMITRTWALHLTAGGFILGLFALLALWRWPRRHVVDAWLGVGALFVLVTATGNRHHEFHQLPLIPPAALLAGLAAMPAFDGRWLTERGGRVLGVAGSAAALAAVAWLSFQYSGVVPGFFRPGGLDWLPIHAGQGIAQVVEPDALIVTVEYGEFGNNSAILLYWAHRRGWSFDQISITPHVVELLRKDYHARYFATTQWTDLAKAHPDLVAYLATKSQVAIPGNPRDTVLFNLSAAAPAP